MDKEKVIYAAGFFDGEGSVTICKVKRSQSYYDGREYHYHRLQISISSTDDPILEWFKENFGGWISKHKEQTKKWKSARRWGCADGTAEEFLRAIEPYCMVKTDQIKTALTFRETKLEHSGTVTGTRNGSAVAANPMTEELFLIREGLREEMLRLNKRGPMKEG